MTRLSTKHVVLGLMVDRSTYGYRLARDVSDRLGFLAIGESSVYKLLERLEMDGWVEETGERTIGRTRRGAPRVLYRATDEGVEQFRRWLHAPSGRAIVRDELHAKLALSQPDDLPQLLRAVEEQMADAANDLASLTRPSLSASATDALPWDAVARMMLDDFKARSLEALVDWLGSVTEVIEQRIAQGGEASPRGE